jgi:hypothetical protein
VRVEDCTIRITEMDGLRIARVRVSRGPSANGEPVLPEPTDTPADAAPAEDAAPAVAAEDPERQNP